MKLSFCNGGLRGNPSKTLPCLIVTSEYTMPFQISWPNCASSYTARHLESQKEILFGFTVIQITPLFCFIKKKMPVKRRGVHSIFPRLQQVMMKMPSYLQMEQFSKYQRKRLLCIDLVSIMVCGQKTAGDF